MSSFSGGSAILTIDGGQIPGIIPVTILERMEEILQAECNKEACLTDCFDLMVGTSEGALALLLMNAINPETSRFYSARKIYKLHQEGELPDRNKDSLRRKTDILFSEKWLSESRSRLYLPVCNVGQSHPWIFDSVEAKRLKSQDFKMSDVAYVGMLDPADAEVIKNSEGDPDYKLCHAEAVYGDPVFEGLQKAIRLFPQHNFFIASLGIGETPRAYGFHGGHNFDTLAIQVNQDRHLNHFYELKRLIEGELSGRVDYIRIQLPLDPSTIQDPAALRQAGLSVSNSQNPQDYPAFKIITEELREAYKERGIAIISQNSRVINALEQVNRPERNESKVIPCSQIPTIAQGHEKIYRRFLNGKLIYKPNAYNDAGKLELRIDELVNPLEGTFDLSYCGSTGKHLSISTGYKKRQKEGNANKAEIWFIPRFLVEKEINGSASRFNDIFPNEWQEKADVGIIWTLANWWNVPHAYYDYLTNQNMDALCSCDLSVKWKQAKTTGGGLTYVEDGSNKTDALSYYSLVF